MNTKTRTAPDYAAQLALFLLERTGSIWGVYRGPMTATEQRGLFGRFLGKGRIVINGKEETVYMTRKVCFGLDSETVGTTSWAAL
jgi:hypothetical protein